MCHIVTIENDMFLGEHDTTTNEKVEKLQGQQLGAVIMMSLCHMMCHNDNEQLSKFKLCRLTWYVNMHGVRNKQESHFVSRHIKMSRLPKYFQENLSTLNNEKKIIEALVLPVLLKPL